MVQALMTPSRHFAAELCAGALTWQLKVFQWAGRMSGVSRQIVKQFIETVDRIGARYGAVSERAKGEFRLQTKFAVRLISLSL